MSYLEDTALDPNLSDDEDWRPLVGWFAVKPHQATLSKNLSDFEERLTHRRDSPIVVVGGPEQNPHHMDRLARKRNERLWRIDDTVCDNRLDITSGSR